MKPDYPIRVAFADDHAYIRIGINTLLSANTNFQAVAEAANGQELIERITALPEPPDVCLLDIQMPVLDGYDTLAIVRQKWPDIKVIILSLFEHEFAITEMLQLGASGFLQKGGQPAEMYTAIEAVYNDGYYHSPDLHRHLAGFIPGTNKLKRALQAGINRLRLNAKEKEFLKHCCSELSYAEIATLMNSSPRTVQGYRDNLFRKLNVQTRIGLVLFAMNTGIT